MSIDHLTTASAMDAVYKERQRQLDKGWTLKHDDELRANGDLAIAASELADRVANNNNPSRAGYRIADHQNFKHHKNKKRMIEIACALLIAEWERLDRLLEKPQSG